MKPIHASRLYLCSALQEIACLSLLLGYNVLNENSFLLFFRVNLV